MSRWLTPQKAARVAKESQRRREERFKSRLLLAGIVLLMAVTYVAWAIISARLRHSRRHQHDRTPSSRSITHRAGLLVPDAPRTFAKVGFEPHAAP